MTIPKPNQRRFVPSPYPKSNGEVFLFEGDATTAPITEIVPQSRVPGPPRSQAQFPLLAANLRGAPALHGLYFSAAQFLRQGIRIGVIGVTTPAQVKRQLKDPFQIINPIQAVQNLLPTSRETPSLWGQPPA